MEAVDPTSWLPTLFNLGGWLGIGAFILVSLAKGNLWTNNAVERIDRTYETLIASKDKQIDDWKSAAESAGARADLITANHKELLDAVRTANQLIEALQKTAEDQR
jgi:hypothetical protein